MRWSCAALLTSLTLGLAHAQDDAPPPPAPEPLALSTDANTVRMVPLQPGQLPDLSVGGVLHPTCGKGVDPKAPCGLRWLPNGDLLVRRNGTIQDGYSRFSRDARGRMRERAVGAWPGRHGPELDPRRRRELSISALPRPLARRRRGRPQRRPPRRPAPDAQGPARATPPSNTGSPSASSTGPSTSAAPPCESSTASGRPSSTWPT